jgi:hypothetical protein
LMMAAMTLAVLPSARTKDRAVLSTTNDAKDALRGYEVTPATRRCGLARRKCRPPGDTAALSFSSYPKSMEILGS